MSITKAEQIFVPKYHVLQEVLNKHERAHWLPDEADMSQDVSQWKSGKITPQQKEFIKMILRLFTQSDTNVCGGYVEKLLPVFKNADARMMLLSFANREVTHVLGYKRLNDTLGYDSEEFMSEFLSYEEMASKHSFMVEEADLKSTRGVAEYLAKQILIEGVNLFASFAMLLNFSRLGLLQGMVSVNQWSTQDENMHVEGLSEMFKLLVSENPEIVDDSFKKEVYSVARKVVELEDKFVDLCYDIWEMDKLSREELKLYIRFICDARMQQMGFKSQWGIVKNPIPWINDLMGDTFGNFFEVTITAYSKNNLTGDWEY